MFPDWDQILDGGGYPTSSVACGIAFGALLVELASSAGARLPHAHESLQARVVSLDAPEKVAREFFGEVRRERSSSASSRPEDRSGAGMVEGPTPCDWPTRAKPKTEAPAIACAGASVGWATRTGCPSRSSMAPEGASAELLGSLRGHLVEDGLEFLVAKLVTVEQHRKPRDFSRNLSCRFDLIVGCAGHLGKTT